MFESILRKSIENVSVYTVLLKKGQSLSLLEAIHQCWNQSIVFAFGNVPVYTLELLQEHSCILVSFEQKRLDQITQQLESGTHEAEANRETSSDVSDLSSLLLRFL